MADSDVVFVAPAVLTTADRIICPSCAKNAADLGENVLDQVLSTGQLLTWMPGSGKLLCEECAKVICYDSRRKRDLVSS